MFLLGFRGYIREHTADFFASGGPPGALLGDPPAGPAGGAAGAGPLINALNGTTADCRACIFLWQVLVCSLPSRRFLAFFVTTDYRRQGNELILMLYL